MSYDLYGMDNGDLLRTHGPDQCAGQHCSLHNQSDHPLRDAVMKWDSSRNLMVRFCGHGLWHPDPDDLAFKHRSTSAAWASQCEIHRCDGCCQPPEHRRAVLDATLAYYKPTWWEKIRWVWIALYEWVRSYLPWRRKRIK